MIILCLGGMIYFLVYLPTAGGVVVGAGGGFWGVLSGLVSSACYETF